MKRNGFVAAALVVAGPASAGILGSRVRHAVTEVGHKIQEKAEKAVVHAIFKDFSRAVRKGQRIRGVRRAPI